MTMLADGGALADATLVGNILIPVGTIGAASVALWLGIQAQRTGATQAREARLKQTRMQSLSWEWEEKALMNSLPMVSYLLAGQAARLAGRFIAHGHNESRCASCRLLWRGRRSQRSVFHHVGRLLRPNVGEARQ
jgi:hypothetical protein